jgi:tetratricopeptide (TPR) repeat protein/CHAT domain-containing protein
MARSLAVSQYETSDTTVDIQLYVEGTATICHFLNHDEAESLFIRMLSIKERATGPKSLEVAYVASDLAHVHLQQAKYSEARPLCERALSIREEALGPEHPEVGQSLRYLGNACVGLGDYTSAEPLYTRSLSILEAALGPDHMEVASSLTDLANLCWHKGKYSEAEPLYGRVLAVLEKTEGPDHPDVATALNNMGNLCLRQGKYVEAIGLFERSLAIREKAFSPEHRQVAMSLNGLAFAYNKLGDYPRAGATYERTLAIREKTLGPGHPAVGRTLNNLASVEMNQGRYAEAEALLRRAVLVREQALGPDHPDVAQSLNNLAVLCTRQGRFAEAEPHYERALKIWQKAFGPDHPKHAITLTNLALLCVRQTRYAEAEAYYKDALSVRKNGLDPEHPDIAMSLNNLAMLYVRLCEYQRADSLFNLALSMRQQAFGPEHPTVALSLSGLAGSYIEQGRYVEADTLYRRALAIREKVFRPDHPDVAGTLFNLADLCTRQGRYGEADSLNECALSIRQALFGQDHYTVAQSLEAMCELRRLEGRKPEAAKLAEEALRIRWRNFVENGDVLSESNALIYSHLLRKSAGDYFSCCSDLGFGDRDRAQSTADMAFRAKGQVSDGIFERQRRLVEETDSTILAVAESLRLAKFLLAKLFVAGSGKDMERYRAKTDSLAEVASDLEADLSRRSASYRQKQAAKDVSAGRIASLLPPNSVLVEYIRYQHREVESGHSVPHYMVVVLPGGGRPAITDLGLAAKIDASIGKWRSHMLQVAASGRPPTVVDEQDCRRLGAEVYNSIWRPIEAYTEGRDLVFVAPDGALNLVSFAGLADEPSRYLIERYPICYLASGRDLIRLAGEAEPARGLFALGDPDYAASVAQRLPGSEGHMDSVPEVAYVTRNIRSTRGELQDLTVPSLPGTRREVELIAEAWEETTAEPLVVHLGRDASEESFKAGAPGSRVIHLATHGYFLEGDLKTNLPAGEPGSDLDYVGENPLLLSGLFLAGANLHGEGADSLGAEDGILTAYEVSAIDLKGTELVVLSACETGLGEVEEGEGVYGLRRAFQIAGARTVISALWPVSDEATADMMSSLYARQDESIPETMRRIQLGKIGDLRRSEQPDHPFTWAGFVALGDWR